MTLHFRPIVYQPVDARAEGFGIVGALWAGVGAFILMASIAGVWMAIEAMTTP